MYVYILKRQQQGCKEKQSTHNDSCPVLPHLSYKKRLYFDRCVYHKCSGKLNRAVYTCVAMCIVIHPWVQETGCMGGKGEAMRQRIVWLYSPFSLARKEWEPRMPAGL